MAVVTEYAQRQRQAMYGAVLDALADGVTMDRTGLYAVLPMVHASTANRVIREMLASGQIVAQRTAPGASHPLRYAATMDALALVVPVVRPSCVRVRLHDGGRYRVISHPCERHTQGRVLVGLTWREGVGVFTNPRGDLTRYPLERIGSVYSSVARGFVPVSQCDRVPLSALPYVPPTTIACAIVAILTAHGPLSVSEIAERLPQARKTVVKSQMARMATEQKVMRVGRTEQDGRLITTWTVGPVPLTGRPSRGRPAHVDTYTPMPWVNPIRARALGLPVAQATREVPETDFGNPRRRAA